MTPLKKLVDPRKAGSRNQGNTFARSSCIHIHSRETRPARGSPPMRRRLRIDAEAKEAWVEHCIGGDNRQPARWLPNARMAE